MQKSNFYFNIVKVIARILNADNSFSDPGRVANVQKEESFSPYSSSEFLAENTS